MSVKNDDPVLTITVTHNMSFSCEAPGMAAAVKSKADLAYFESQVGWGPVLGMRVMTKSIMFVDFDPKPSEWPIGELINFLDPTSPT